MVTLESHGPIIFNPSRCSPSDFKAADNKYIQLSNNELGETGRPAVFCTFGSVRDSHLVHGVSLTDEWSNKSLNLCPLILELDRMVAFFAAVFNLTVVEIRPSRTEGLSFSTGSILSIAPLLLPQHRIPVRIRYILSAFVILIYRCCRYFDVLCVFRHFSCRLVC